MGNSNKYLYGAAVQGIQSFILQTNELKDIVGASELVEQICTTKFASVLGKEYEDLQLDPHAILMAAGNIKYVFDDVSQCRDFVREFPKSILEFAPGITVSQAVVQMTEDFRADVNELERRLRAQRNKKMRSLTLGYMGIRRSRKTGLPAVVKDGEDYLDLGSTCKRKSQSTTRLLCKKSFNRHDLTNDHIAFDIGDIAGKNDWIAVIHVDGNGLGQAVRQRGQNLESLKKFSKELNVCTVEAANAAYEQFDFDLRAKIPIRPIVLGGDDMTVICRADLAIRYVETFIRQFEKKTEPKMTACAGIAFIKSSYPFHYGYNLADQLCDRAKKEARANLSNGLVPSCFMFYKVQDSFIEKVKLMIQRELTPQDGYSFEFGPYYLNDAPEGRWTIEDLMNRLSVLEKEDGTAVKSNLRQWLTCMYEGVAIADQKRERMISLFSGKERELIEEVTKFKPLPDNSEKKETQRSAAFDLVSLYSIFTQDTKSDSKQQSNGYNKL